MANPDIKSQFIARLTPEQQPGFATGVRKEAANALQDLDIPTQKWEEWKYTSVKPVFGQEYQLAGPSSLPDIEAFRIPELEADLLVFVNGKYEAELSHIDYNKDIISISSIQSLTKEQQETFESHFGKVVNSSTDIFSAVNTAYAGEGVFIHVGKGKRTEKPVHLLHLSDIEAPTAIQNRNLFVVDANADAKIIESYHSLGNSVSFRNGVTEIVVGKNAGCEYVKLQTEGSSAMMMDRTEVYLSDDCRFSVYTLTLGGDWVRNNVRLNLSGKNIETHLMGLSLLSGKQHVDNFTNVDHREPNCYSNELYKGILTDSANGVFNGKIHVYQKAQKTNAFQSNRNILLSDEASIYTKPQLEIYADDVKCSHGATTGRIDEEALFYLQARGVPAESAKRLMVHAFAAEVIQNLSIEPLKAHIDRMIWERFA